MTLKLILIGTLIFLTGCHSFSSEEEDLRTVPVTNNPHAHPGYQRPYTVPQVQY